MLGDLGCDVLVGKRGNAVTDTDQWESFDWPAAYAKTEANFSVEFC
jgi:hypothetical protein